MISDFKAVRLGEIFRRASHESQAGRNQSIEKSCIFAVFVELSVELLPVHRRFIGRIRLTFAINLLR